jgi:hypothetical protein
LEAQRLRLEHELASLSDGKQREVVAARIEQLQTAAAMFEFLLPRESSAPPR